MTSFFLPLLLQTLKFLNSSFPHTIALFICQVFTAYPFLNSSRGGRHFTLLNFFIIKCVFFFLTGGEHSPMSSPSGYIPERVTSYVHFMQLTNQLVYLLKVLVQELSRSITHIQMTTVEQEQYFSEVSQNIVSTVCHSSFARFLCLTFSLIKYLCPQII